MNPGKRRARLMLAVAAVMVTAVAGVSAAGELEAELQAWEEAAAQALVSGDIDAMMELYAEDAVSLPNYGPKLEGREAIRAQIEREREQGIVIESFSSRVETAWECDGRVYAVGRFGLSVTLPGLERPQADTGKYMAVWRRKDDGTLRVVYEIWNTDVPPGQ